MAHWGGVRQRREHLFCLTALLPDVVFDHGVSAAEAVLVPEPLVDALGRVPLLPGDGWADSRMASITPVKGSIFGLRGGLLRV